MTLPSMMRRGDLAAMQARAIRVRDVRVEGPRRTRIRLWLPLTPLFWILWPLSMLLAPLLLLAPPMRGANPYRTVALIGRVLTSMGGTLIDVDTHDARVRITIL
jgi:hypothetical protein